MVRRSFRLGLRFGILAGIAVAVVKVVQARRQPSAPSFSAAPTPWPPVPTPAPAKAPEAAKAQKGPAAKKKAPARAWVEASGDVCPPSHPVKGKLSSKLYHLPGMFAYARTHADRCYEDGDAAEADGLTRAKR